MNGTLTNETLNAFLQDSEVNTKVEFLEEGKGKEEIIQIAKARGILIENSRDLAGFKAIYTFPDKINTNGAILPKNLLLKHLPTLVGKSLDIDHIRRYVIGYLIDYRYQAKENMVIVYGIIFKDCFKEEWTDIKKMFKAGALRLSYEIWCPKNKRNYLTPQIYELTEIEVAGGGIMFSATPAFKDAYVLELAKENIDKGVLDADMVYACITKNGRCVSKQYRDDELIISSVEQTQDVAAITTPAENEIKCSNCNNTFKTMATTDIKCPNCYAILDSGGTMVYPPQFRDFNISCSCGTSNWLILKRTAKDANIKCLTCAKEYKIIFEQFKDNTWLKMLPMLYGGRAICPQCGHANSFFQVSDIKKRGVECKGCGLKFEFNIEEKKLRKIKEIIKLNSDKKEEPKLEKASVQGGKDMLVVSKYHRVIDTPNIDEFVNKLQQDEYEGLEVAKTLTSEARKDLSDKDFAAVIRVKDKKTGELRKIRKYPINDVTFIKNAWALINQSEAKTFFIRYNVSAEAVKAKIVRAAKKFEVELSTLEKAFDYETALKNKNSLLKKAVRKIIKLKKLNVLEVASVQNSNVANLSNRKLLRKAVGKIRILKSQKKTLVKTSLDKDLEVAKVKEFYTKNGNLIAERIKKLGGEYIEMAKIKPETLIEDEVFELHMFRKKEGEQELENLETASQNVGDKTLDEDYYAKRRKEIDIKAYPNGKC